MPKPEPDLNHSVIRHTYPTLEIHVSKVRQGSLEKQTLILKYSNHILVLIICIFISFGKIFEN